MTGHIENEEHEVLSQEGFIEGLEKLGLKTELSEAEIASVLRVLVK